jgi:hypothetical protein
MLVDLETALGPQVPATPAFGCAGWVGPGHAATRDIINGPPVCNDVIDGSCARTLVTNAVSADPCVADMRCRDDDLV